MATVLGTVWGQSVKQANENRDSAFLRTLFDLRTGTKVAAFHLITFILRAKGCAYENLSHPGH